MLITRLYLRNFRVYEDELDLHLPPGLVGVYGPNGSGKSTLLEAVLFTLWGKSRTKREHIRSSGVAADCVTEVEFEHEGHLYLVRRRLKGINSTMSVEAHCDGALMSTATRDAERYVESVLGMDDDAFRASVFTEQKQLAAFSNHAPDDRRRLVLQLLGITPLDAARDAARKDARQMTADHDRLRGMLADLAALQTAAADADARAGASQVAAAEEATAAAAAADRAGAAAEAFRIVDLRRQEYDGLVVQGRGARQELDVATAAVEQRRSELAELDGLAGELARVEAAAAGLEDDARTLELLTAAASAARALESVTVPARPEPVEEAAVEESVAEAGRLREAVAAAEALLAAAREGQARANQALARSASLAPDESCPTCGQALGDSFARVRAHRAEEAAAAEARVAELESGLGELRPRSAAADRAAAELGRRAASARTLMAAWEQAEARRRQAHDALVQAWAAVPAPIGGGDEPAGPVLAGLERAGRDRLATKRAAHAKALTIRGRLDARAGIEASLAQATETQTASAAKVEALRDKLRAVGFRREELDQAAAARDDAATVAAQAADAAHKAALEAAAARERARATAEKLEEGRAQHAKLSDLESDARHRSRVASLLGEFRNTIVASVGPRLAVQAAALFGELTDHEYEDVQVHPDTYQLQISDGGRLYGLERFSGSEIDLANLALRVAISEHIHFQSGGSVGLLVLDEVFGPLDDDRKARMLLALERLRGRFRQVLVVTHDNEIKEQMPNAIEVVKLPGRRATARNIGD